MDELFSALADLNLRLHLGSLLARNVPQSNPYMLEYVVGMTVMGIFGLKRVTIRGSNFRKHISGEWVQQAPIPG